jgi:hypothetical protein
MKRIITFVFILVYTSFTGCEDSSINKSLEENRTTDGQSTNSTFIAAMPCKNILIDASHDGGVWWFPQVGSFSADLPHQGSGFENQLKELGFSVDILSRNQKPTQDILQNYSIIIRANGFESYSPEEVDAYKQAVDRGVILLLLSDHQKYDSQDEVANMLGVSFQGSLIGEIKNFSGNKIFKDLSELEYLAGSYIVPMQDISIQPLAWLENKPVIAFLPSMHSRIFLMGDTNAIEASAQPFVNSLISWMQESCNEK